LKVRLFLQAAPQGADKERKKTMYAVIKTGGKQYRVAKDDVVTIERLPGEAGSKIEFDQVLMVGSGASVKVGTPTVAGAKVTAELVEQARGPKLIAFKKRRRKNSRRKKGHRQDLSTVRITSITGA
jgi:large subunit ribosomal protein L21